MSLTLKITGDNTLLRRALEGSTRMVNDFGAKVGKALTHPKALVTGLVAQITGVAGALVGLKKAFDVGSLFSDFSARTGEAVSDLVILEQAFRDAGIEASRMPLALDLLTQRLTEARQGNLRLGEAFRNLGLDLEHLEGQSRSDLFRHLLENLAVAENQILASASAMQIFGTRFGGTLNQLAKNPRAFTDAADTIGDQAQILERNAGSFDRIADLLLSSGKKLQGFLVGVASEIGPRLESILEKLNKLDFARQGQELGKIADSLIAAFEKGRLDDIVSVSLQIGFEKAILFFETRFHDAVIQAGDALSGRLHTALASFALKAAETMTRLNPFGSAQQAQFLAATSEAALTQATSLGRSPAQRQERVHQLERRLATILAEVSANRADLRAASDAAAASRNVTDSRAIGLALAQATEEPGAQFAGNPFLRLQTSSLSQRGGGGGLGQAHVLVRLQEQSRKLLANIEGHLRDMKTQTRPQAGATPGRPGHFAPESS